ncbi:MAG: intermembrane phospholipid transport protein YdbH family protein [Opitutaceae bacterium]
MVDTRDAEISVSGLGIHPESGLTISIQSYSEPSVTVENAVLQLPWSGLFNFREALELTMHADSVKYIASSKGHRELTRVEHGDMERAFQVIADALEGLSNRTGGVSVLSIDLEVETFEYCGNGSDFDCSVQMSVVQSFDDTTLIELSASNEVIEFNSKTRIANAQSVAIDFAVAVSDWRYFSQTYFPQLQQALTHANGDLTIGSLSENRFGEASGYIRWNAESAGQVNAALLGNLAPLQMSWGSAHFATEVSSFGVATNGGSIVRGYAKTPLRSIQVSDFQALGGSIIVHIDDFALHLQSVVEGHAVEVRHQSVIELLQGSGLLSAKFDSNGLTSDMLSAFGIDVLPPDLVFTSAAHVEGDVDLLNWQPVEIRAVSKIDLPQLEWLSQSVFAKDVAIQSNFEIDIQNTYQSQVKVEISHVEVAGIPLNSLFVDLQSNNESKILVERFAVNLFGGEVTANAFTIQLKDHGTELIDLVINNWDLKELTESIPQFEGQLSGRVSGQLALVLEDTSISLSGGKLSLDSGVDAHLAYALNGLLTQGAPKGSQAFKSYQMAERAFEDLNLKRLEVNFFPQSDQSKPIKLSLYGESEQDGLIVPVDYTLNVNADDSAGLIQLLRQIQRSELEFN